HDGTGLPSTRPQTKIRRCPRAIRRSSASTSGSTPTTSSTRTGARTTSPHGGTWSTGKRSPAATSRRSAAKRWPARATTSSSSAGAVGPYRGAGGTGTAALYSRDAPVPYPRPPLSKRYLRGEAELESTYVEPAAYYEEQGVELELRTGVARLHPDAHEVELEN